VLAPGRVLRVIWPFLLLTFGLVALAIFSMDLLSAARAYVGGEGLWSKAQKQAVYSLNRYADSGSETDFQTYRDAIAIPLGDFRARMELEKQNPDLQVVHAGFVAGRNEPEDIPGMIRLFRWFRNLWFMARAIEIWTVADAEILRLTIVADRLRDEVAGPRDGLRVAELLSEIDRINRKLTPLEDEFSFVLGEASRLTNAVLGFTTASASLLLLGIAFLLTRRILAQRASFEDALRVSEERYALAAEGSHDGIWDWNVVTGQVYYSPRFMQLLGFEPGEVDLGTEGYLARLHPDDLPRGTEALERHRQYRVPYDVDYRLKTKSGEYRWFHARGQTVRGADDEPLRMAGSITDITERKRAEDALRQGEAQLRKILQAVPFPILISRLADRRLVYSNDYALRQFRHSPGQTHNGRPTAIFVDPSDEASILESLRHGEVRMHEVQMKDGEGNPFWALVSAQKVTYAGELCVLIGLYDITERKRLDDDIRRLAFRDTLTTLPNRAAFDQAVNQALAAAERATRRLAVLFVDLDQFKQVNDRFGHKGGDRLLQGIATRLGTTVRQSDCVARLGGDEFVVLLPEIADQAGVAGVAWKLLDRIAKPLLIDDTECAVTASIGISCYPEDGADLHTLLKNADIAMYRAKAEGKNTFRFYSALRDGAPGASANPLSRLDPARRGDTGG
jgi:diguanylate cyclase (GGDEF)-like protein/PAS domain S-box-containing protein